ncbi:hypothetical protein yc1106_10123 [Curvularia clavata]|uniref:C2H2-type domain-containing protein n=1 Tax=Curvularia clavata TaxID=95742 RepID=A0A9Q8ZJW2_CURCL|nr:hypothetical protein yc1106_10123 [Curvularia clavata]
MLPEFTCNLLETLPLPPWKEELVWNLHATNKWEKRIPFSYYVQPTMSTTTYASRRQATFFHQFSLLPAELQFRVLSFCPATTLFQLMRVSSVLRTEASKLFWSNPDAYFLVEAYWLLNGGFPGYHCYDPAFLENVQNVEIEYEPSTNNEIWPRFTGNSKIRLDLISTFWESVKWRFPQVKKIVINQNGEPRIWKSADTVPPPLQALVEACPPTIDIRVLVSERKPLPNAEINTEIQPVTTWQRSVYQFTSTHTWTKVESRHSQTILLPIGQFDGLVGRFEMLKQRCARIRLQRYGLWPLAIQALDRHHFDSGRNNPFACPWPACDAYFDRAGAWTTHAAISHYHYPSQLSILPDDIQSLWEQHVGLLEESQKQAKTQFRKIREEWENAGLDGRGMIERTWREQLGTDNRRDASSQETRENKTWESFVNWANGDDY